MIHKLNYLSDVWRSSYHDETALKHNQWLKWLFANEYHEMMKPRRYAKEYYAIFLPITEEEHF